jgi:hypothetical protein
MLFYHAGGGLQYQFFVSRWSFCHIWRGFFGGYVKISENVSVFTVGIVDKQK